MGLMNQGRGEPIAETMQHRLGDAFANDLDEIDTATDFLQACCDVQPVLRPIVRTKARPSLFWFGFGIGASIAMGMTLAGM